MIDKSMRAALLRILSSCAFVCMLFAMAQQPAPASVDRKDSFPAVVAARAPALDGTANDPIWQTGLSAKNFVNFTTRKPAALNTVAYLLYDDKNIYVAFVCEQPGVPITAKQTTNDVGSGLDDYVGVSLDT